MKQLLNNSILKICLLITGLMIATNVVAHDFELNGIYYNKTSNNTVEVTRRNNNYNSYSGNLIIPNSISFNGIMYNVTSVGDGAFKECIGLTGIDIPNSVTAIGSSAFYECENLPSVAIPYSVTTIGRDAFENCPRLSSVHITDLEAWCRIDFKTDCSNPLYYAQHLFLNGSEITELIIPSNITSIGNYAFQGCIGLTSLYIPNNITSIGSSAFFDCRGLTSVNIPNSITSIGDCAFTGCRSLANVNIPSNLTSIKKGTFWDCSSLISINIPNSVTSIGDYAFSGCSGLTSMSIPNSVTSIGNRVFAGCSGLTSINIPNSITAIGEEAFTHCSGLTSVSIPNSITSIGSEAFAGCIGLTSVSIPKSVSSIGYGAFQYCSSLNDVYSHIVNLTSLSMGGNVFYNNAPNHYAQRTLHVPVGSVSAYQSDSRWSTFFGTIVEMDILATSIFLNKTSTELTVGETMQLTATVLPNNTTNKTVIWTTSNNSIVVVNSTGMVTALAPGTATITATTTDGSNLSASCQVTVNIIPVSSISLNKSYLTLDVSETYQLAATVLPSNATIKTVIWKSDNTAISIVTNNGIIIPKAPGHVTITATTTDGTNLTATCQVTIVRRITGIALSESNLALALPETSQLTAIITPSNASNQVLNWSSSKPTVATVDNNGFITSVSVGTTTIKATTTDGTNLSASCQVTVYKQYVSSITLNKTSLIMHTGDTFRLLADIYPDNASNPTLSWSSGNSTIASVDNNGLVTAINEGTTYIRASATDGSYVYANCMIEVLPDYYITIDTLSHIRGVSEQVVDLPVTLVNKNPISGIQFDITLPNNVEFNLIDGQPDVWLDEARGTRTHSVAASQLDNGKYRVLITSSASMNLRGNDGVLVHMNMILPQIHSIGNYTISITNIIASESDETRHTLNNTSSTVRYFYIVGDADANALVDIADHASTASKILGKYPSPFYYDAANVDGNNSLDVVDLVGITNIALEIKPITIRQAPTRSNAENRLFCNKLIINAEGESEITIGINFDYDFSGFQMDIMLPDGLTLIGVTLADEASRLGLVTETMQDGTIRILGTSFTDVVVNGFCPQLMTIRVKADRNYLSGSQIEFKDILFAERDLTAHHFDSSFIDHIEPSTVFELMNEARIYVEKGNIIINTPVAGTVQLIAVDGRIIEYHAHVGPNMYSVNASGIYIIHFLNKTIKVLL